MRATLRVKPHQTQGEFMASEAMIRLFIGGIGSGKTWAGAVELCRQPPGTTSMVVAPTYRVLKDATLPSFMSVASEFVREHRKSDMTTHLRNDHTILWRTAVEPDRLRGANLGFVWIDEGAMIQSGDVFDVLLGRLRLAPGHIIITTTPKGQNWVYDLTSKDEVEVFKCSTRQNVYLPDHFYDFVRDQYTSELAQQELEGEFIDFSGGLFRREWFILSDVEPPNMKWYRFWDLAVSTKRSADFTATARVAVDEQGRVWISGIWQARAPWPIIKRRILDVAALEPDTVAIGIETVAGFEIAYAELMSQRQLATVQLRSIKPTRDKTARAAPLAARAESGRVVVVKSEHSDLFIGQASLFPHAKHDDLVDAVAGALTMTVGSSRVVIDATNRILQREVPW